MRTLGRRGQKKTSLSQKSKIFASSPEGRAKAAYGDRLPAKLKFDSQHSIGAGIWHISLKKYEKIQTFLRKSPCKTADTVL